MIPARSASLPTKKPGTSCKKISGMLNASHKQVKWVALSQPAASIDPAKKYGLLAMKPTERLSEDHRDAIVCRYVVDLSEDETAAALGVRRGTVKSRLSRALERLREELEGEL